jgi:hypothetical protein
MADEKRKPPLVNRAPPVDAGLLVWAKTLASALTAQQGVEIIGSSGGSTHFRFRGQTFSVTVQRTS